MGSAETTASGASIFIEEDTCSDLEQTHAAEGVAFLAIEWPRGHKLRATAQAPPRQGAAGGELVSGMGSNCGESAPVDCTTADCWETLDASYCPGAVLDITAEINDVCCRTHGSCNDDGFPTICTDDCAGLWMPLWERCDGYILDVMVSQASAIQAFTQTCETLFDSTCTDAYYTMGLQQLDLQCPSDGSCPV